MELRQLLVLPTLRDARILTGAAGLDRGVTGLAVAEVPARLRSVQAGDLVLTTFYAYRDMSPAVLQAVLGEWIAARAAGVIYRPSGWQSSLPAEAVATARDAGFPLLMVAEETDWLAVIEDCLGRLRFAEAETLRLGLDTQSRFLAAVSRGATLAELSGMVAEAARVPVVLLDRDCRVQALASPPGVDVGMRLRNAIRRRQDDLSPLCRWLEESGARTRLLAGQPVRVPPGLFPEALSGVVLAITARNRVQGYLMLLGDGTAAREGDLDIVLQYACSVVGLALMRDAQRQLESRMWTQIFERLAEGYILESNDFSGSDEAELLYPGVVLAVSYDGSADRQRDQRREHLVRALADLAGMEPVPYVGALGRHVVAFVPCADADAAAAIRAAAPGLVERLAARGPAPVQIVVGELCQTVEEVWQSCQAQIQFLGPLSAASRVQGCDALYRLLLGRFGEHDLLSLHRSAVQPLAEYDQAHGGQLEQTLLCFLDHDKNLSRTARALFLHRNGLLYRLNKIEHLLDLNFDDVDACLNWHLVLKIPRLLGDTPGAGSGDAGSARPAPAQRTRQL